MHRVLFLVLGTDDGHDVHLLECPEVPKCLDDLKKCREITLELEYRKASFSELMSPMFEPLIKMCDFIAVTNRKLTAPDMFYIAPRDRVEIGRNYIRVGNVRISLPPILGDPVFRVEKVFDVSTLIEECRKAGLHVTTVRDGILVSGNKSRVLNTLTRLGVEYRVVKETRTYIHVLVQSSDGRAT